jgi:uncharacterized alpha-E superfamily protein
VHGAEVSPKLAAEFLIFSEDFPRSVEFCTRALDVALRAISGVAPGRFSNQAEKLCGRLLAELQFSTIDEVFETGLHQYLDLVQQKLNAIGEAVFQGYISQRFEAFDQEIQQQQQQQQ